MRERSDVDLRELQTFVVQLGAAMNAAGESVHTVQARIARVARAYGARSARISAFPTFMMVTMGRGEPATVELTSALADEARLDQLAALDLLVGEAERGTVEPADGLRRIEEIGGMGPRFGPVQSIVGYAVLSLGLCLILRPGLGEVGAAVVLGALVGLLRSVVRSQSPLQVLLPVVAAFSVSALSALAIEHDVAGAGLRAIVASLIVFLPGATLTTAVLELAAGQMVSGASRLVAGSMRLALLAFGIVAGIDAVGVPSTRILGDTDDLLGSWAPWLGVLVFAGGVMVANSAPARSFPGLLAVLYVAWSGQVLGNFLFGGYMSALLGAAAMTPAAVWVARFPSAMPAQAAFRPGFWLLVPGALGLIGLTQLAGEVGAGDPVNVVSTAGVAELLTTVVSIFAVAVGVLCGSLLVAWGEATRRVVDGRLRRPQR